MSHALLAAQLSTLKTTLRPLIPLIRFKLYGARPVHCHRRHPHVLSLESTRDRAHTVLHTIRRVCSSGRPEKEEVQFAIAVPISPIVNRGRTWPRRTGTSNCSWNKFRANTNAITKAGWTPLHLAAENGSRRHQAARERIQGRCECPKSNDGRTPLHLAAQNGHVNAVKLLVNEFQGARKRQV